MAGIYRRYDSISSEEFQKATKEQIIHSYIPLALKIAKRFPGSYINRHDAIGIALLELTRIVHEGTIRSQAEFTNYVNSAIYNKLKAYCKSYYNQSVIRTKGRKANPATSQTLSHEIGHKDHGPGAVDFRDFIEKIIRNPMERIIINRIIEGGYVLNDIAEETGVSTTYVHKIKEQLFERLKCVL